MGDVSPLEIAVDGVRYRAARGGSGPPVLLLHGFTGSSDSWEPWLSELAGAHDVLAPDLLGHGASDAPAEPARYAAEAQTADLAALLDAAGIERAAVVGYSMGARLALAFAAACPERVERLALESGSPGVAAEADRAARRTSDEALARRIERDGVAAFVEEWERLPLFAAQARLPESDRRRQREQRLANRPQGLAGSLRGFGQGVQPPLHGALAGLAMPVLLLAGAEDEKYARLAREMASVIPGAELKIIEGAGHVPHLERPERFRRAVGAFLGAGRRARPEG